MSAQHSVYAFCIPTSLSGIQQRNVVAQPVALNQLQTFSCTQQMPSTQSVIVDHDKHAPRWLAASGKKLISIAVQVEVLKNRVLNDHSLGSPY